MRISGVPVSRSRYFAVGVADEEIDRLREQKRPHVPKIAQRIDVAIRAERIRVEDLLDFGRPGLAAVGGENVGRLATALQKEFRQADAQIRIAIERELLAMNMRARICEIASTKRPRSRRS